VDNAHLSPGVGSVGSVFITFYLQKANILRNSQRRVYVLALGSLSFAALCASPGDRVRDLHFKNASLLLLFISSALFYFHCLLFLQPRAKKTHSPLPLMAIWKMQTKMEFENVITIGAL
jgi:hypothetical protein